jgi:hypothetical protein
MDVVNDDRQFGQGGSFRRGGRPGVGTDSRYRSIPPVGIGKSVYRILDAAASAL